MKVLASLACILAYGIVYADSSMEVASQPSDPSDVVRQYSRSLVLTLTVEPKAEDLTKRMLVSVTMHVQGLLREPSATGPTGKPIEVFIQLTPEDADRIVAKLSELGVFARMSTGLLSGVRPRGIISISVQDEKKALHQYSLASSWNSELKGVFESIAVVLPADGKKAVAEMISYAPVAMLSDKPAPGTRGATTQRTLTDADLITKATHALADIGVNVENCRPEVKRRTNRTIVEFVPPITQRGGGGEVELSSDGAVIRKTVWR